MTTITILDEKQEAKFIEFMTMAEEALSGEEFQPIHDLMVETFPYSFGCPANNCGNPIDYNEDGCSDHVGIKQ